MIVHPHWATAWNFLAENDIRCIQGLTVKNDPSDRSPDLAFNVIKDVRTVIMTAVIYFIQAKTVYQIELKMILYITLDAACASVTVEIMS